MNNKEHKSETAKKIHFDKKTGAALPQLKDVLKSQNGRTSQNKRRKLMKTSHR